MGGGHGSHGLRAVGTKNKVKKRPEEPPTTSRGPEAGGPLYFWLLIFVIFYTPI